MTTGDKIVVCRTWGQKNRLRRDSQGTPRCGRCKNVLRSSIFTTILMSSVVTKALRVSAWITFFPMAVILICFSGLLLMWIGELKWWISLPLATLLLPLPALSAFWPARSTSNPKIAAIILIGFWIVIEAFTLSVKGLTLPWHQNVIRLLVDIAIIGRSLPCCGRKKSEHGIVVFVLLLVSAFLMRFPLFETTR